MCPVPAPGHAHIPQCDPGVWHQHPRGRKPYRTKGIRLICYPISLTLLVILTSVVYYLLRCSSFFSRWEWWCALLRSTSGPTWMTSSHSSEWVTVSVPPYPGSLNTNPFRLLFPRASDRQLQARWLVSSCVVLRAVLNVSLLISRKVFWAFGWSLLPHHTAVQMACGVAGNSKCLEFAVYGFCCCFCCFKGILVLLHLEQQQSPKFHLSSYSAW